MGKIDCYSSLGRGYDFPGTVTIRRVEIREGRTRQGSIDFFNESTTSILTFSPVRMKLESKFAAASIGA